MVRVCIILVPLGESYLLITAPVEWPTPQGQDSGQPVVTRKPSGPMQTVPCVRCSAQIPPLRQVNELSVLYGMLSLLLDQQLTPLNVVSC